MTKKKFEKKPKRADWKISVVQYAKGNENGIRKLIRGYEEAAAAAIREWGDEGTRTAKIYRKNARALAIAIEDRLYKD